MSTNDDSDLEDIDENEDTQITEDNDSENEESEDSESSLDDIKVSGIGVKLLEEYKAGKYSPKDIWKIRDEVPVRQRNEEQKWLVKFDDANIMQLRKNKLLSKKINSITDKTPYKVPLCEPLRKEGDNREDIYCLSPKEKIFLLGDDYGYSSDKHPEVKFLDAFSDINTPPTDTIVYYSTYNNKVPTLNSQKYIARFYGKYNNKPFTAETLHIDKGTANERDGHSATEVKNQLVNMRKKSAENRKDIEDKGVKKSYLDGIESVDKLRIEGDGTDTFRDAIAIHDAPHSVALFINQMKLDKKRPTKEQKRQFAIHNITGFVFPYGVNYVKYYTQKQSKVHEGDFPLIVTSVAKPVEELLDKNGCPTMWRRWCTRIYKQDESKDLYKTYNMDGLTQLLGMSRFQSKDRAGLDPAINLSYWIYDKSTKTLSPDQTDVKKLVDIMYSTSLSETKSKLQAKMNEDVAKLERSNVALQKAKEKYKSLLSKDNLSGKQKELVDSAPAKIAKKEQSNEKIKEKIDSYKKSIDNLSKDSVVLFKHDDLMKNDSYKIAFEDYLKNENIITEDIEGSPFKFKVKLDAKNDKWVLESYSPNLHIYQAVPNFELDEKEQRDIMKEVDIQVHPIVEKFGQHGCMMCPFRDAEYYYNLRKDFPELYAQARKWEDAGSTADKEYRYLFTPKKLKQAQEGKAILNKKNSDGSITVIDMRKYLDEQGKPIF